MLFAAAPVAGWKGQHHLLQQLSTAVSAAAAAADIQAANVAEGLAAANVAAVARLPQAQVMTARDELTVAPMIYFELLSALPFRVVLTSTRSLLQPMQLVPATGQRRGRSEGGENNAPEERHFRTPPPARTLPLCIPRLAHADLLLDISHSCQPLTFLRILAHHRMIIQKPKVAHSVNANLSHTRADSFAPATSTHLVWFLRLRLCTVTVCSGRVRFGAVCIHHFACHASTFAAFCKKVEPKS